MSGSFGEMGNLLSQAQEMDRRVREALEELGAARIEGAAGGGVVRATVDGVGQVQEVHISEEALRGTDRAGIEELLVIALKDAQTRAKRQRDERMTKVTGGVQLPWFS
ncbi:MAG: YbaB/EbfC family nucleoid-associated protein [Planctomycetota bacterium]